MVLLVYFLFISPTLGIRMTKITTLFDLWRIAVKSLNLLMLETYMFLLNYQKRTTE
jgi:hypothetical protein